LANGRGRAQRRHALIYYASSDTRIHVARTTTERLLDYVQNTPPIPLRSRAAVDQRERAHFARISTSSARAKEPLLGKR